jgi:hypothetical protein
MHTQIPHRESLWERKYEMSNGTGAPMSVGNTGLEMVCGVAK